MQVIRATLDMWSDNKTAWWWQGDLILYGKEGNPRPIPLSVPGHIDPEGGIYSLAMQNSNDNMCPDDTKNCNPHATACQVCVTWRTKANCPQLYLPPIFKVHP
jgi:hypothetical protein